MSNNKQSSVFVKTMIFVVLAIILTVGVTYAYFRATITGVESESTISIGGATLKIVYEGTETINAENVIPGWSAKKYFNVDVTNTSGKDIEYDINLVVTNSNFNTTNDTGNSYLEYALYKCTSDTDTACETVITSSSILDIQSGEKQVYSAKTKTSGKTYYALELSFPNQDAVQTQTGTNDQPLTFTGYVTLVSGGEVYIPPFTTDSWATIASNIKSGNTSKYKVGETKEVAIDGFTNTEPGSNGLYTVRIANNSTPSECSTEGFSQTACGFVVEFVDIITGYNMNPAGTYNDTEYPNGTNLGGWPSSAMYKYLNGDTPDHLTYDGSNATLYSKLPSDLRSAIKDTYTVSGHGSKDTGTRSDGNFESIDKLYLLTTGEVWGDCLTSNCWDTSSYPYNSSGGTTTRQLDYYQSIGVSTSSYSGAIKQKNGSNASWWLRAAVPHITYTFRSVNSDGYYNNTSLAYYSGGVAPAFRIGK